MHVYRLTLARVKKSHVKNELGLHSLKFSMHVQYIYSYV